jgi:hypothetical protein
MTVAYRELMDAVEARVADDRELRRLDRHAAADERLDDEEREHLRRRIAFYLSDMHLKMRPEPELLPLTHA